MNKFNSSLFFLLFIFGCSPSPEQIKKQIDSIYTETKSIPASEPCKNLEGYKKLKETEDKFNTSYYLEMSLQKIEKYKSLCDAKTKEIEEQKRLAEEEARRLEELKKVGDWNKGYFVDDFGDRTNEGFISQTTKGLFSNSATEGSPLRAKMFINNANLERETPWFRLYEYDGSNPIKGIYSRNSMSCRVKDHNGTIINMELSQYQGSDSFYIDKSRNRKNNITNLKDLISSGGKGAFVCVNDQYGVSKYVFEFNFKYFDNIARQFYEGP